MWSRWGGYDPSQPGAGLTAERSLEDMVARKGVQLEQRVGWGGLTLEVICSSPKHEQSFDLIHFSEYYPQ